MCNIYLNEFKQQLFFVYDITEWYSDLCFFRCHGALQISFYIYILWNFVSVIHNLHPLFLKRQQAGALVNVPYKPYKIWSITVNFMHYYNLVFSSLNVLIEQTLKQSFRSKRKLTFKFGKRVDSLEYRQKFTHVYKEESCQ
jgi:hypothetical protein